MMLNMRWVLTVFGPYVGKCNLESGMSEIPDSVHA